MTGSFESINGTATGLQVLHPGFPKQLMFFLSLCLFRCLLWCAGTCRDVEHLEGRWPPRRMDLVTSGASRVVLMILAWKVIYAAVTGAP